MNIFVCIKQTPDTEATIKVNNGTIDESAVNKWIISPYDEYALEEALRLKQKHGGTVTALSAGPVRVAEALRSAYAVGVDKAIHIMDDHVSFNDSLATARLLAKAIEKEGSADIILAGIIGQDMDNSQTGVLLAEFLKIPHISIVTKLEIEGTKAVAECEIEGGKGKVETNLPVLVTTQQGLNEPRYPSLKGIMAAKKKQITVYDSVKDLGVDATMIGKTGQRLEILEFVAPPQRPAGTIVDGKDAREKAISLVKALHTDAKIL